MCYKLKSNLYKLDRSVISFDFRIFQSKAIDCVVKLKGEAVHFLLIAEKQVDRQGFKTQDQGNKSQWFTHPGSDIS